MRYVFYIIAIVSFCGCTFHIDDIDVYQKKRNNMVSVKSRLMQFNEEDVLMQRSNISVAGKYVLLQGLADNDKVVHVFSREDYRYITSFGNWGEGPGYVIRAGDPVLSEDGEHIYLTDVGHYVIYQYHLDSAMRYTDYKPQVKLKIQNTIFPVEYKYFSDTLCYGVFWQPVSTSNYIPMTGKFNLNTGEIEVYEYQHPDINNMRFCMDASLKHGIYVEANYTYDLMCIFDLNGRLKRRIYGPNWESRGDFKSHYRDVFFYKDYILAVYDGGLWEKHLAPRVCHVFDINGNYIKTIDIGYNVSAMSVDEENDRLLLCLDNVMQFAYLDLKDIL